MPRKKSRKKAASEVFSIISDEAVQAEAQPSPKEKTFDPTCDYCGKKRKYAFMEADPEWELPGHPDHIHRAVCVKCAPDVNGRYDCSALVFKALEKALAKKDRSRHEIDGAIKIAWRSFHVELNRDDLIAMAKKLRIKHPWLSKKRSK